MLAELERARGEQLHAEAEAEHGAARRRGIADRLREAALAQRGDRVAERADAGQQDPLGGDHLGGVGHQHGRRADRLQRVEHGPVVAHAVVDEGDQAFSKTQYVMSSQTPSERGRKPSSTSRSDGCRSRYRRP